MKVCTVENVMISYPVEVDLTNGDVIDAWVVITESRPYRPATRLAPSEGGDHDWYISLTEDGPDAKLDVTEETTAAIVKYMDEDIRRYHG
jgi:hypothetical protein